MTSESIKKAISESDELAKLRRGETLKPPPNYDVVMCLYEREADGSDAEKPFLSVAFRPQDFATNPHMKYQRFAVMKQFETDGKRILACSLVHLYWDGSRDADSAKEAVRGLDVCFSYGPWKPTAPSDPLEIDDFWDEALGDPPNGHWDYDFDESEAGFVPFDNFARPPYLVGQIGGKHDEGN